MYFHYSAGWFRFLGILLPLKMSWMLWISWDNHQNSRIVHLQMSIARYSRKRESIIHSRLLLQSDEILSQINFLIYIMISSQWEDHIKIEFEETGTKKEILFLVVKPGTVLVYCYSYHWVIFQVSSGHLSRLIQVDFSGNTFKPLFNQSMLLMER